MTIRAPTAVGGSRVGRLGPVTVDMPAEPPVALVTDLSRTVRMIEVGHTGDGGFAGILVGSTRPPW